MSDSAETVHRGVRWRRGPGGEVSFLDESTGEWVKWAPGVDAPPLPPRWSLLGVPTRVNRPGWRSRWRIIPLVLVVAAVGVAIYQTASPSQSNTAKEQSASSALLGKCLAQDGTFGGRPKYRTTPVACNSQKAAVKVVTVVSTSPGGPGCPPATTPMQLAYPGVAHPHLECLQPLHSGQP